MRTKSALTFAIDIGHNSKYDTGAVGITTEDTATKGVGTRVMQKLIALGYNVVDCSPFNVFNGAASGSEAWIANDGIKTKAQQVLNNISNLG